MVDDVKEITETAESKASAEALDRARLARERREAEQRKRLDELRAHAAAAQAQREKRDEERRRRQAEQRARDDDRRQQVEERKRAIWEASVSRREALLQRERDRSERMERARAARSAPRPAFAFGSSTPRLLEPLDSGGFFWAARRAASTTNVMFASAPLVRRASALQLDSDTDNKDEPDRQPQPVMWSSVARRRTDLVPTVPAPRAPGRAYSMTRLDKIPTQRPLHSASPSMHHLNRTQPRSGETTPGSRPGSALAAAVPRRPNTNTPRRPRPASIAGTGVNTPRGGAGDASVATTPSVSRDSTVVGAAADVPRRAASTPRRPRPASMHAATRTTPALSLPPGEGKPPLHRKPKPSKEHDKRGKSTSASPGRSLSPPNARRVDRDKSSAWSSSERDKSQVSAIEVSQKLEALQIHNGERHTHDQNLDNKVNENKENIEVEAKPSKPEQKLVDNKPVEEVKPVEKETTPPVVKEEKPTEKREEQKVENKEEQKVEKKEEQKVNERREEKKEPSLEKTDESEMTASMTARRITTAEEAKAALAERRRRAREEAERQAELERQRLQREAEEEAERQRLEEERQRREEEEARELARLQRQQEEEKLRKAIEAAQQAEREEAERQSRSEAERAARAREEEDKRRAAERAERLRREDAERQERERVARKQRVEAIMARTRLKKQAEEDKKQQEKAASQASDAPPASEPSQTQETNSQPPPQPQPQQPQPAQPAAAPQQHAADAPSSGDNGNAVVTEDLLGFGTSQPAEPPGTQTAATNNGNLTADLLGLSEHNNIEDKSEEQSTANKQIDNAPAPETNNGNQTTNVGHISANFIQTERLNESQTKADVPKLIEDDFTTHNGHGAHNHPLTLQNAI
ncbi:uncharacterized abhydrolase domain-containing protein DDB_G0269086-like isoform X2 [Galleria mellonella]|uniref:Uncharacterized abhydrolase domain-containing protein DDB_G0269086-like isoform X2 n=1 Tax=Galleria mellonella TaxID=7137 RepID=A0ABM3MRY2_GALME|nr:uncharacterized abhydrolase domain-containing protein DDB_G0269086-like isoform X2 [Galleria mellonella]